MNYKPEITKAQQDILLNVLENHMEALRTLARINPALKPSIKIKRAEVLTLYKTIVGATGSNSIEGIEITEIKINPLKKMEPGSHLAAHARIILNRSLCINSIRVVQGRFGPFISFPREFNQKVGKGYNLCYPITKAFQDYLSERIIRQWSLIIGETSQEKT